MMMHKVGDVVTIKSDLRVDESATSGSLVVTEPMLLYSGKKATVARLNAKYECYKLKDENGDEIPFYWSDRMLEPTKSSESKKQTHMQKAGDKVKIRANLSMDDANTVGINEGMLKFAGKTAIVSEVMTSRDGCYKLKDSNGVQMPYAWEDSMFDHAALTDITIAKVDMGQIMADINKALDIGDKKTFAKLSKEFIHMREEGFPAPKPEKLRGVYFG